MIPVHDLPESLRRNISPEAPQAVRLMLARGQIPLGFSDRLTVWTLLEEDPDGEVSSAAAGSWAALETEKILGALTDRSLSAEVLDQIAARRSDRLEIVLAALSHPNVSASTFDRFADSKEPAILDRIANNQRVLLSAPETARRLLTNPALELSVAGRLRSLLGVEEEAPPPDFSDATAELTGEVSAAPGGGTIPGFDGVLPEEFSTEIPKELLEDIEGAKPCVEVPTESTNLYKLIQILSVAEKIKLAMLGSKSARRLLSKDANRIVVNSVIRSPKLQEDEVIAFAQDRTTADDVLSYIMTRKDWMKNYQIKLALCKNPKTPIPRALRILDNLNEKDLRAIAKSRNVPSQISSAALRHVLRKGPV